MSAELPLPTRTLLILTPSIMTIMTSRSSWGCFTPLASSSEKYMSWFVRLCFRGGRLWILFTCLWCDFLRDLNDPPIVGPPMVVFISPSAFCERGGGRSSFLREPPCWSFWLYLLESSLFTYCFSFPFYISSSICFFRSLQSSIVLLFLLLFLAFFCFINGCQSIFSVHILLCFQ